MTNVFSMMSVCMKQQKEIGPDLQTFLKGGFND